MFISVLIANYNNEKYLDECLTSVEKQTLNKDKFEVIVVDDKSTDKSIEVISKYEFVKLIPLEKNIGLSAVRGELIKASSKKATHIFFLDADDSIHEQCLEELVDTTLKFPNNIAACGTLRNGKLKSTSRGGRISIINTTQHSKLWPKKNLVDIQWPSRLKNEDDYALPWAIGDKKFVINKKAIYYHRVVPGSLSTIKNKDNAIRTVDLALANWPINDRNLALLHHSVTMEGAGKYFKKQCKEKGLKRPNFFKKCKFIGFKRTFADFWTDILF